MTVSKEFLSLEIKEYEFGEDQNDSNDEDFEIEDDSIHKGFEQHELNDLAWDMRLHEKSLFEKGSKVSYYWSRESAFLHYFWSDDGFVYCHNI